MNCVSNDPPGRSASSVKLACVRHPLVDQDQRWAKLPEYLVDLVAGVRARLVSRPHQLVGRAPTQLPRQLAPQRPDLGTVVLHERRPGRDLVADQDRALHALRRRYPRLVQHGLQTRERPLIHAREQVEEREHRVRLAPAEVRLQLDHGVSARSVQPLQRAYEQVSGAPPSGTSAGRNSSGFRYSRLPSSLYTCHRSAANSAWLYWPF